ncbi:MAG: hypothetical protein M3340_02595 [Actinomycetota bacterium]|nr:hypothetical protein [Actinomycetota bacterium]
MPSHRTSACLLAIGLLMLLPASASAARQVPPGFFGTVADAPLTEEFGRFQAELDPMVSVGVESVRMVFDWREAQPYRRHRDVPPDQAGFFRDESGVPTDWRSFDAFVAEASLRRLRVLPVVMFAPPWAAKYQNSDASPPSSFPAYAKFVAALAKRYGRTGTFWTERPDLPKVPIEWFQVWNEPHFREFWSDQPWERQYAKLLRTTYKVVKEAAPSAKILVAGMANKSWTYLAKLYAQKTKGFFDAAALHPFTNAVDGVVEIIERGRKVMERYRDRKRPLMITELSWTSAKGKAAFTYGNERTEEGQAKALRQGFQRMARERRRLRILRVYWYTWMTRDAHPNIPFDYAGVVRLEKDGSVTRKPAFEAYRATALALEGRR